MFEGLFENLRFQRLLAQEPMKFANLVLQSPILTSRHDLFPAAGRSQAALRHQPTPGEQLVWGDAMPTSHQAYRHTRLEGLFDHANLLRGRPAPTTLNRRDDPLRPWTPGKNTFAGATNGSICAFRSRT